MLQSILGNSATLGSGSGQSLPGKGDTDSLAAALYEVEEMGALFYSFPASLVSLLNDVRFWLWRFRLSGYYFI